MAANGFFGGRGRSKGDKVDRNARRVDRSSKLSLWKHKRLVGFLRPFKSTSGGENLKRREAYFVAQSVGMVASYSGHYIVHETANAKEE
jgi:hypothetical protein